jgi:hypothetical protein
VASRLSSTTGSARSDGREPVVARVVQFSPRERGVTPPANDNVRPIGRHMIQLLGPGVALALVAAAWLYVYLS